MSTTRIEEFITLVGETAAAELTAAETAVTEAIARVEAEHPGYRHSNPTEIRCTAWACSQFMEIKIGPGNPAADVYAAHRAKHVDALLAIGGPTPENPGN